MPIYEYACRNCGELFEELVFKAADEDGLTCPKCGAGQPERCLSACAAVVAGGDAGRDAGMGCAPPSGGSGGFR